MACHDSPVLLVNPTHAVWPVDPSTLPIEIGTVNLGRSNESKYTFRRPVWSSKKRAIFVVDTFTFPLSMASINSSDPTIGEYGNDYVVNFPSAKFGISIV